ncbi:hypothetical protein MLC52_05335 [Sulfurimonas sp. NW15]|uniref:hypothetical protein n=1 Tax=Sulfurimonas sp. NW15 TaxID=2922729 RepID=UPI003DA9DEF9
MINTLTEYNKKSLANGNIFHDKENYMKNFHLGIERENINIGNVLLINTSGNIDIVEVLSNNKILTIEVLNKKINEILNKKITIDFLIKVIILSETKLGLYTTKENDGDINEFFQIKKRNIKDLLELKKQEEELKLFDLINKLDTTFKGKYIMPLKIKTTSPEI